MQPLRHYQKSRHKRSLQDKNKAEIISLLQKARSLLSDSGIRESVFESEVILAHLLNVERHNLYIEPPLISKNIRDKFFFLVSKRASRIPLAYLLGKTYFFGYEFYISKGVFIPRPETETIISCACWFIKEKDKKINILDICTGCGALAICLVKLFPGSIAIATDVSKKAVNIAQKNVLLHKLQSRISVIQADIVPESLHGKFSLIVSNPPYLTAEEIEQTDEEIKKEPFYSLYGGKNGMEVIYRILCVASKILKQDGFLIIEVSPLQIQYFKELKYTGLKLISTFRDICGIERLVVLRKNGINQ